MKHVCFVFQIGMDLQQLVVQAHCRTVSCGRDSWSICLSRQTQPVAESLVHVLHCPYPAFRYHMKDQFSWCSGKLESSQTNKQKYVEETA